LNITSHLIFLLFSITAFSLSAQKTEWKTTIDSTNIFSSPRFVDLNNDSIPDVLFSGGLEGENSPNGVNAIDGKTGEILWSYPSATQLYTSAQFEDITGDGVLDIFVGGRAATFFALNGKTGQLIWEFWPASKGDARKQGYLNFFSTQWISDVDGDKIRDLLVMNAGDYLASPEEKNRPTAQLMVLSSSKGQIIQRASIPEKRESYFAPQCYLNSEKEEMVIYGSGGETVDGSLWQTSLKNVLKGDITRSELLLKNSSKGFILNALLNDANKDGHAEIYAANMDATLSAIDGKSKSILWEKKFPGYECYVTPSFGQLTNDSIEDFITIIAKGNFPMYESFRLIAIDGLTGEIICDKDAGFNQFSPVITVDLDSNGIDEMIYIENDLIDPNSFLVINQLKVIDLSNNLDFYIGSKELGMSMASTPTITTFNNLNSSIIKASTKMPTNEKERHSTTIERIELNKIYKETWGNFLGPNENGNND